MAPSDETLWDWPIFDGLAVREDTRWKQVAGFPMYWVSNNLDIFNMKRGKLLLTYVNHRKIVCVRIYRDGKGLTRSVVKLRRDAFGDDIA